MLTDPYASPGDKPRRKRSTSSRTKGTRAKLASRAPVILVVDDQADGLEFLNVLLSDEGFEVVSATSGAEALMLCRERAPDLAIVDVMMPGMTGFELCELLRNDVACRDIPIIVYTGHDIRQYSNTGLYDVAFTKPSDPDDILTAIRALLPNRSS